MFPTTRMNSFLTWIHSLHTESVLFQYLSCVFFCLFFLKWILRILSFSLHNAQRRLGARVALCSVHVKVNNLHPCLCESASNSWSIFTACFVFMVHACRASVRCACVYDEEAEPGARKKQKKKKNPSLMVWSEGSDKGQTFTRKRGGRICNRMGFCSRLWLVVGQVACHNGADLSVAVLV